MVDSTVHPFLHVFIGLLDRVRLGLENEITSNKEMNPACLVLTSRDYRQRAIIG